MITNHFTPEEIAAYYNRMNLSYMQIYGDVIQAFRPADTEKLLDYIARNAGVNWKLNILDLGCGVGGPAMYFAKKWNAYIDGVTVSDVQIQTGTQKINNNGLSENIHLFKGDYHQLNKIALKETYDIVLFLESLGHSNNVKAAIKQAATKLKQNGVLYIKDFYKKHVYNTVDQAIIDKIIHNINVSYCYNTLDLEQLTTILLENSFKIEFIRPFDFTDDISIRYEFEKKNELDIFEGNSINPAEWLEIKAIKL